MRVSAVLLASALGTNAYAAINDYVGTLPKVLGQVHVASGVYYFQSYDLNWGAPGCPNARYAYIAENDVGAKAIFAAALTAKTAGTSVSFGGLCGDAGGDDTYIRVKQINLP